ncbi:hypothetical protein VTK56DRAFT_2853 [Thermocarpiscus australiensis]
MFWIYQKCCKECGARSVTIMDEVTVNSLGTKTNPTQDISAMTVGGLLHAMFGGPATSKLTAGRRRDLAHKNSLSAQNCRELVAMRTRNRTL